MTDKLDLYELIDRYVNADTIQDLFRVHKKGNPEAIRIGGTKTELIERLKSYVSSKEIDSSEVFNLLRDAEENGNQGIHYFQPKRSLAKDLNSPDLVGSTIFGNDWEKTYAVPELTKLPDGTAIVDFRRHKNKPRDWILKLYAYSTRRKFIDRTVTDVHRRYSEI